MSSTKDKPIYGNVDDVSNDVMRFMNNIHSIVYMHAIFGVNDNCKKINFVLEHLKPFGFIDKILSVIKPREVKCNKKSLEFRELGNEDFRKKNYVEAFELFNKSICYAESGTDNLSIGYANRSAVLFELKYYRECLANIELARKANYPSRLMHKLEKREKDCLKLVESQPPEEVQYNFQLSYKPHQQLPHIAECLEFGKNPQEGRFVFTNRDLAAGDLIAIEEPYCSTLHLPLCYKRCAATCKNENYFTLIPCEKCCMAMFCSEECHNLAVSTFHKYECPIIDLLQKMFNSNYNMALRVCLSTLELFPTIEELMGFCAASENQNKSAFDLDYSNLTPQEHYRAIHGLVTNQHLSPFPHLFHRSVVCAVLKYFLIEYTPLKEFLVGEEGENFFTELLFRHLHTSIINMHATGFCDYRDSPLELSQETSGAYAFMSLINHSCASNTLHLNRGTKVYLFVMHPIRAGGRIYDTYGPHFFINTKLERISQLSTQFYFICKCVACQLDYPKLDELQAKSGIPNFNPETIMKKEYALNNFKKICKFLTRYGNTSAYPCSQICMAEEYMKLTLHYLLPKPKMFIENNLYVT